MCRRRFPDIGDRQRGTAAERTRSRPLWHREPDGTGFLFSAAPLGPLRDPTLRGPPFGCSAGAAGVSHHNPRTPHGHPSITQKFHEKTLRGTQKERNGGGRGKKARNVASLPPPPFGAPPFGAPKGVCSSVFFFFFFFFHLVVLFCSRRIPRD